MLIINFIEAIFVKASRHTANFGSIFLAKAFEQKSYANAAITDLLT